MRIMTTCSRPVSAGHGEPEYQRCIHMAMNSGQEAAPDLPDPEDSELDTGPLQDSQDAIDKGREAAREALKDNPPETEQDTGSQSEQEPQL
jgi:hypothetical protein